MEFGKYKKDLEQFLLIDEIYQDLKPYVVKKELQLLHRVIKHLVKKDFDFNPIQYKSYIMGFFASLIYDIEILMKSNYQDIIQLIYTEDILKEADIEVLKTGIIDGKNQVEIDFQYGTKESFEALEIIVKTHYDYQIDIDVNYYQKVFEQAKLFKPFTEDEQILKEAFQKAILLNYVDAYSFIIGYCFRFFTEAEAFEVYQFDEINSQLAVKQLFLDVNISERMANEALKHYSAFLIGYRSFREPITIIYSEEQIKNHLKNMGIDSKPSFVHELKTMIVSFPKLKFSLPDDFILSNMFNTYLFYPEISIDQRMSYILGIACVREYFKKTNFYVNNFEELKIIIQSAILEYDLDIKDKDFFNLGFDGILLDEMKLKNINLLEKQEEAILFFQKKLLDQVESDNVEELITNNVKIYRYILEFLKDRIDTIDYELLDEIFIDSIQRKIVHPECYIIGYLYGFAKLIDNYPICLIINLLKKLISEDIEQRKKAIKGFEQAYIDHYQFNADIEPGFELLESKEKEEALALFDLVTQYFDHIIIDCQNIVEAIEITYFRIPIGAYDQKFIFVLAYCYTKRFLFFEKRTENIESLAMNYFEDIADRFQCLITDNHEIYKKGIQMASLDFIKEKKDNNLKKRNFK